MSIFAVCLTVEIYLNLLITSAMRKLYTLCLLSLSLIVAASAQTPPSLKSGSIYTMSYANVTLEIDSALGGRITSLKVYDPLKASTVELLNSASDINQVGSTFWPSPQAPWNWPPLATLDNLPYRVKIDGNAIILSGGLDPTYLLRFHKRIVFNPTDTSIVITYTIKNENLVAKTWAPWEVTRVPASGLTFFKKGDGNITGTLYTNVAGRISESKGYWWYNQDLVANKVTTSGGDKMMCDGLGWLAHCPTSKNRILIKRFQDIPLASAATGESEVQIYTGQNNGYTELENQGAAVSIPSMDSISWTVRWYAKVLPFSATAMNVSTGSTKLITFLEQVLTRGDAVAGIRNQSAQTTNVFVNAAQNLVTVQSNLTNYNNVELVVYDLLGKVALKQALLDPQQQVSVKNLAAGSYLYQINAGTSSISKGKFMINR